MHHQLPLNLKDDQITVPSLKSQLDAFGSHQKALFLNRHSVTDLIIKRAEFMDQLLQRLWQHFHFHDINHLCLVAVGGYGRKELHPLSDIDILILSTESLSRQIQTQVSKFITLLWDLKLEVGHAVRTVSECAEIGQQDLTVATNLQESRLIIGCDETYYQLKLIVHSESFWPTEDFYQAKIKEQKERHSRYHDTTYNLEPDIKSTPGGLRDIHTLSWIARRHFGATSLLEMSNKGFLTHAEYAELIESQDFLWRIRFALHLELKRYDNRLTFAHQAQVADHLGYTGDGNQPVEMMMKAFYRTLQQVSELNKMLLKLFDQVIPGNEEDVTTKIINDDFQVTANLIETRNEQLFHHNPASVIEMFIHIANDSSIEGVAPETMRQLRSSRHHLDQYWHCIPEAREKFMLLVRHPNALHKAFRLMHRHGVLAAYLPQWNHIVGQMQFDLFHVYTVDEHSVRLLNYLYMFDNPENHQRHPICCEIFPRLQKKELLILAAIFHDIGKGRGGDHSEIGAVEAYDFCIEHNLSKPEAKLVSWLVKNHLLMSVTAQRRDIYDPDVIIEFATIVREEEYLEHLICLTVADICATNPELWNSWKRTLLAELFYSTQRALRRGLEKPVDVRDRIRHNQQLASALLRKEGFVPRQINRLWQRFKADYFLRHTHKQIAWHSASILHHQLTDEPLILISEKATRGGTEIFVYTKDQHALFATVVAELDRKGLNVHDAQIMASKDDFVLDTFITLGQDGEPIAPERYNTIIKSLRNAIERGTPSLDKTRRIPGNLKHFKVKTQIDFLPTKSKKRTLLEFVALDTPGLLATVGATFAELGFDIHGAKITTIGERAEDLFIITSPRQDKLTLEEQERLKHSLIASVKKLLPE